MTYKRLTDKRADIFATAMVTTDSPQKAVQATWPAFKDKPGSAAVKGNRLLKRPEIQDRINKKLEKMQPKALKRIDKLINSDNEQIATINAWRAVESVRGKPVSRNVSLHATLSVEDAIASLE